MPEHRYEQYCALARALDIVGDRWTLLIVRELWPGPRRFTDLVEGLPGVSRKLLTERLRDLERDGILARRELAPPAARQVYELTEDGRALAGAIRPLIAWGAIRIGDRQEGESFRTRWPAVAIAALADHETAEVVNGTYQFLVGDTAFHFIIEDGSVDVRDGRIDDPTVVWTTDEQTWEAITFGTLEAKAAIASGAMTVAGDRQAAKAFGKIFSRDRMVSASRTAVDRIAR